MPTGRRERDLSVERYRVGDGEAHREATERGGRRTHGRATAGLHKALHGNATAFGYSVTITASFGAVQLERGQPGFGELVLFGMGAVIAFACLEGPLSHGFREPLEAGTDQVITLATALAFVSVALGISTARAIAATFGGAVAWFGAALGASLVFVIVESLEFALAEWVQERRDAPCGDDKQGE